MEYIIILLGFISAVFLLFAVGDVLAILGIEAYDRIYTAIYNRNRRRFWKKVKRGQI